MSGGEETKTPPIEWTMSAALQDVVRKGSDIPEVTNLREAVEAWRRLDVAHRAAAVLTTERPIMIEGVQLDRFEGHSIQGLAELLD